MQLARGGRHEGWPHLLHHAWVARSKEGAVEERDERVAHPLGQRGWAEGVAMGEQGAGGWVSGGWAQSRSLPLSARLAVGA